MGQAVCIELPRPGRVGPMCGKGTGSCPRHDITLPLCSLRITDLRGQKRLHRSMAKVTGRHGRKGPRKAASTDPKRTVGTQCLVLLEHRNMYSDQQGCLTQFHSLLLKLEYFQPHH